MEPSDMYDLVYDAVKEALRDELDGREPDIHRRFMQGTVKFVDSDQRVVKEIDVHTFFKKVTSVREKLRVLEQKLNNHDGLSNEDKADLQAYISRAYGSLTTFNFLFRYDEDKFRGTGG